MSVNKAILIGNVGRDPEIRYLENNVAVAQFTLATSERGYTDRNGNVVPDRTEWHNIVLWRGLAEVAEKYVRKGTQIYIEGKITNRSYDAQDGSKRYVSEIVASNMTLLGRRGDDGNQTGSGTTPTPTTSQRPTPEENPYKNSSTPTAGATTEPTFAAEKSSNDDLPF